MSTIAAEGSSLPRLPVWRTAKAGYRDTYNNRDALVRAAALPLVIAVLLESFIPEGSSDPGLGILRTVLSFVVITLFQALWLRFLLLRSPEARPGLISYPGKRFLPFLGYYVLLLVLYIPALLFQFSAANYEGPTPALTIILIVALYALAFYFGARLGFTFLWIAVDAPQRLGASWRATRKNGMRIVIVLCLTAVPLLLLPFGVGLLMAAMDSGVAAQLETTAYESWLLWILIPAGNVILYLYYALACSVLVQAFSTLTGWSLHRREVLERFE